MIKVVLFEQDKGEENSGKRKARSLFSFPFNQLKLTYKQNSQTERAANLFHGNANSWVSQRNDVQNGFSFSS